MLEKILKNRFTRLVYSAIISGIVTGAIYLVDTSYYDIPFSDDLMFVVLVMTFGLSFIAQFLGDIINVKGFLNNGFCTFVKIFLLFASCILGALYGYFVLMPPGSEFMALDTIDRGLTLAMPYIPVAILLLVVFGYSTSLLSDHKILFILISPLALALGVGLGIGNSYIIDQIPDFDWVAVFPALPALLVVLAFVTCKSWRIWPFNEYVSGSFEYTYQGGGGGGYSPSTSGGSSDSGWDVCRECIYFTYSYDKYGCAQYHCRKNPSRSIHDYMPSCHDFKKK